MARPDDYVPPDAVTTGGCCALAVICVLCVVAEVVVLGVLAFALGWIS